ncbi:RDD family protein [Actinoallomurus vinaceus]
MARSKVTLASGGRRIGAAIIDGVVLSPVIVGYALLPTVSATLWLAVFCFGYFATHHVRSGRTFGKYFMGIKVMSTDFADIGIWTAVWRAGFATLLAFLTAGIGGIIDLAWSFWDPDGQTLHDKVANTWVIVTDQGEVDPYGTSDPHLRR